MRSTFYGEFGPGCAIFYQTAYAIHLFHVFGFDSNQRIQATVKSYLQFWKPTWCGVWCTINVLRMLIEHPLSAQSKQVESGLKYLSRRQSKRGAWRGFPFYHTFHALSRAHSDLAKRQVQKALPLVVIRQNDDGSWGRKERETEFGLFEECWCHVAENLLLLLWLTKRSSSVLNNITENQATFSSSSLRSRFSCSACIWFQLQTSITSSKLV